MGREKEQGQSQALERFVLLGTLMVSGCAQAPEAQVATDYLAGVTSFDEVPVSEGTTVRTSERGVVVEERFTREIDPELTRAREAQVRALVAEYREERDARDVLREDLAARGDEMVQVTFNMRRRGCPISHVSRVRTKPPVATASPSASSLPVKPNRGTSPSFARLARGQSPSFG